jgi:hypothetical protein
MQPADPLASRAHQPDAEREWDDATIETPGVFESMLAP